MPLKSCRSCTHSLTRVVRGARPVFADIFRAFYPFHRRSTVSLGRIAVEICIVMCNLKFFVKIIIIIPHGIEKNYVTWGRVESWAGQRRQFASRPPPADASAISKFDLPPRTFFQTRCYWWDCPSSGGACPMDRSGHLRRDFLIPVACIEMKKRKKEDKGKSSFILLLSEQLLRGRDYNDRDIEPTDTHSFTASDIRFSILSRFAPSCFTIPKFRRQLLINFLWSFHCSPSAQIIPGAKRCKRYRIDNRMGAKEKPYRNLSWFRGWGTKVLCS